ncbi:MAG: phospholipid transport system substrate-binding protein [Rhodothermales bacterium]|jgi:phospholipid transport system substrate-binding protein
MSRMLLSRILNTAAVFLLLMAGNGISPGISQAQAPDTQIRALLEQRDASIKALLGPKGSEVAAAKKAELRTVVNGFLDFGEMAKGALGPHWAELSAAQQTHFVDVFSDIVRSQSLANLDPYRAAVTYTSITVNDAAADVVTSTVIKDVPMVVAYKLVQKADTWVATDIILDEVSTVEGYSRSFRTMIRKRGFDTLMERLEKRRDDMATD